MATMTETTLHVVGQSHCLETCLHMYHGTLQLDNVSPVTAVWVYLGMLLIEVNSSISSHTAKPRHRAWHRWFAPSGWVPSSDRHVGRCVSGSTPAPSVSHK